ncbi:MAG: leukotoxin LktA family filamentous adhesin, partial [Selenomonadales bacterium]|nr:leukotoxin LktA family filamentous adhesin [Selenomonadales bacterium]
MTLYGKWAKQSEKKRKRPAQKDRTQRDLLVRSVIAATTFTFFSPMVASADIISGDNAITTVDKQNNIYTVESHKYFGNSAVNWFSQFGLGANEIANLYFGTQADNSKLNLYNFVDSKIDVNGTVNAIQNNKVGGNLFFLSKEGIAVGANGVINAGSLTLLTPSEDYYKKFIRRDVWNSQMDDEAFAQESAKIAEMNIPLSPTGEIMVK